VQSGESEKEEVTGEGIGESEMEVLVPVGWLVMSRYALISLYAFVYRQVSLVPPSTWCKQNRHYAYVYDLHSQKRQ